jgi:small-conductance mechanosensitive channel
MKFLTETAFFGNTLLKYLIFLAALSAGLIAAFLIGRIFARRLGAWSKKRADATGAFVAVGLRRYALPAAYFFVIYLSAHILTLSTKVERALGYGLAALATYLGAAFFSKLAAVFLGRLVKSEEGSEGAVRWMAGIVRAVIWMIAAILFLDNVGVKMGALVTGLGVGGIAVAFAAQSVLTDIFCFITIFFDKPFVIGDFIVAGDQAGTVEHIGLKTTRLRALGGEQLVVSNADLTSARVSNYKTMTKRRVVATVGVTYETPPETLRKIPGVIEAILGEIEGATFSRAHFSAYGPYSLNFEIVYFVEGADYIRYMDINQQVNLRIKEEFAALGVRFAYPTQKLFLERYL